MVCITGLEHHVSQLADLCPPAGSLLHLDVAPVQEVLPPVFPRHCLLWWGPPHHSVCVRHESQGTPRGKQRDPTGGNWTQEIPLPLSSVGPTSTFSLFCHTDEKDSFCFGYFMYFTFYLLNFSASPALWRRYSYFQLFLRKVLNIKEVEQPTKVYNVSFIFIWYYYSVKNKLILYFSRSYSLVCFGWPWDSLSARDSSWRCPTDLKSHWKPSIRRRHHRAHGWVSVHKVPSHYYLHHNV